MKNQFLLFAAGASLILSCQTEEVTPEIEEIQTEELEITAETISTIQSLSLNSDDVETIKVWCNFHFSFSIILCLVQKK